MSTINITGTGGIIEGNLGSANVNVNLDPVYGNFNGSTSSVNAGSPTMFDDIFNGAGTITAWVHPKGLGGGSSGRIFDKSKWVLHLYTESNNVAKLRFFINEGDGVWTTTNNVLPFNAWSHVAVVYDGSSTSNNPVIYINGVSVDVTENDAPSAAIATDATSDLFIGNRSGADRGFNGYIMDAKIYKAAGLSITQIPIAAAKINQDPDLISPNPPKGWYKFNASTTADSSGNINTASASNMVSEVYDEFSVDVYDNSTTTDGSFTITQGKVEGLALSSLLLDGNGDNVGCGTSSNIISDFDGGDFTVSAWFNPDGTGKMCIFSCGDDDNDHLQVLSQTNDIYYSYEIDGTLVREHFATDALVTTDKWHHITVTKTGSTFKFYLNGVQLTGATSQSSTAGQHAGNFEIGDNFNDDFFDGTIRDVRVYDGVTLSDEQAASLYSNTFVVTPTHMWKMDEGTGSTANDTGTGTARNGTLTGNAALSDSNGTLDLDHDLVIAANGTLSAPRGTLELAGTNVKNVGAFTHNSGTVKFNQAGNNLINNDDAANDTVFHNVISNPGGRCRIYNSITVENSLTHTSGTALQLDGGRNITLTMGTATSAGSIDITAGEFFRIYPNATTNTVTAANSLFPCVVTGADWSWSDGAGTINLSGLDFQYNITTGTNGSDNGTLTLTGDCEFDAVTVSSEDTLDLNGQRAVFGGDFDLTTGALDWAGSMAIFKGLLDLNGRVPTSDANTVIIHDPADASKKLVTSMYSSGTFVNLNNESEVHGYAWASGTSSEVLDNVIAAGTFDAQQNVQVKNNMTAVTGCDLRGNDRTLTVAGDFTTSGGLIGKSALSFPDGGNSPTGAGNALDVPYDLSNLTGDATIEFWMYADANTNANSRGVINGYRAGFDNRWQLYHTTSNNLTFYSHPNNKSITVTCPTGKWSHVAIVCTGVGGDVKLYIDGKLKGQTDLGSGVSLATPGAFPDFGVNRQDGSTDIRTGQSTFEGELAMLRIWTDERTESELRANMFATYANLASNTDCAIAYEFDEGTSTDVDDKVGSNNGTLVNSVTWAGAGTFTRGTSTVNMTGSTGELFLGSAGYQFNNLGVAPSGGNTNLQKIGGHSNIRVYGTLTHNGGSFNSPDNMSIEILGSGTVSAGATLPYICYWNSSTNVPTSNYQYFIASGNTVTFGGNCTFTGYWRTGANEIVGGAFSHSVRQLVADSGGKFDLRNTTVTMTGETGSTNFHDPNSTITTGNTTITGHASRTYWTSPAAAGHEIVGDVSNLNFQAGNDLTIVGSVTNCIGEGFRQWHHTLDTQQLLDADEAGDDDLRLEKPALDNANELQTG